MRAARSAEAADLSLGEIVVIGPDVEIVGPEVWGVLAEQLDTTPAPRMAAVTGTASLDRCTSIMFAPCEHH